MRKLSDGDTFGEIALLEDVKRTAQCVCSKETQFLILNKIDYM